MKPLLLLTIMALPSAIWQTACSAGESPYVIFEDDFDSDSDGPAALCQFNGNSGTAPFNVQVKEFGSKDIRVRARVMVTQPDGYVGLCVRSDAADNARGLNLRIQPGNPGLRLYNNDSPLAQTCTHGTATDFAINTWYTVDLQVEGDQLIGRLYDDYNGRTLLEQVEVTLASSDNRRYAGLIARDKGERADWFQSIVGASEKKRATIGVGGKKSK